MNREQMIEKAALAVHGIEGCHIGCIPSRDSGEHALGFDDREVGTAVVDALLPQVTTVDELEALWERVCEAASPAVVIDRLGQIWTLIENPHGDWFAMRYGDEEDDETVVWVGFNIWCHEFYGPLTVVWQP